MAGRQKHLKRPLTNRSKGSYRMKMIGLLSIYAGPEVAGEVAREMEDNYTKVFEDIYHKIHNDPSITTYLDSHLGAGLQFVAYQIINETIYAVLLTRSETASVLLEKYTNQGVPGEVVTELMARVTNVIRNINTTVASMLGTTAITPGNVVRELDNYVLSTVPAPASASGVRGVKQGATISPIYAGTPTFSSTEPVSASIEELRQLLRAR